MEEWRDIKGYEGYYQVSNQGRIRNTNSGRIRATYTNRFGYIGVGLHKDGEIHEKKIHRLVAEAFIPNPDNLPEVNHKDENKENNTVENLEWCTRKYNINYGTRNDRQKEKVTNNPNISKPVGQYTLDGELVKVWPSLAETGRNGYNPNGVGRSCRGERGKHKGYKWQYIN